jgi:catechol 2,3-dioxygenase-like lactoylglutathione lyase family enzyme
MINIAENGIVVGLVVRDADAILDFYQNALGLKLVANEPMDDGGTKYYLRIRGGYLKLFAPGASPELRSSGELGQTGFVNLAFVVTNLDEICEGLNERGVEIVSAVQTTANGTRWTVIADPEGNHIELAQTD